MNNSTHITSLDATPTSEAESTDTQWLDILQFTLFAVIFTLSATGNTLVCLVVARTRRMRTTRNYLLVNLAVSDLTVALLCIPFDMVLKIVAPDWPLGTAMCKLLWPSVTLVTNSSAATLAVISYDRWSMLLLYNVFLLQHNDETFRKTVFTSQRHRSFWLVPNTNNFGRNWVFEFTQSTRFAKNKTTQNMICIC